MEQTTTPAINLSAVELHRPPDEIIQELEAKAARYERSFLNPETDENELLRLMRALGWRTLN